MTRPAAELLLWAVGVYAVLHGVWVVAAGDNHTGFPLVSVGTALLIATLLKE